MGDGGLGLVRDVSHHLPVTARSPHQTGEARQPGGHGRVQCSVFSVQYHRESTQPSLPQLGGVAHGRQTERRNEIILYELSESRDFLIFFLHYLDVLSELYDSLAVRLKSKLSDHSELNLRAEREDNLLVPDHAVPRLLLGGQYAALVGRTLKC